MKRDNARVWSVGYAVLGILGVAALVLWILTDYNSLTVSILILLGVGLGMVAAPWLVGFAVLKLIDWRAGR